MRKSAQILVAEDDVVAREAISSLLTEEGYRVVSTGDGKEALEVLERGIVDAALLDVRMPGMTGLEVLRRLQGQEDAPAVLVMTAYGSSSVAIEAMKLGAYDYVTKPVNFSELSVLLDKALRARKTALELAVYRCHQELQTSELTGASSAMQKVYKLIGQVAPSEATVLIRGESGTGKELVARALHQHSARHDERLVKVNCAAIPDTLLEAELFGHERGAFTGAVQRRIGKLEHARGGTVFLDEVAELSQTTQAKLLRVLQERVVERLGSNAQIDLDIRVIAATNRDLEESVRSGSFREDLYYRLNVFTIELPPLRARREDIGMLAETLLHQAASRLKRQAPSLSREAIRALEQHHWPGNVRELEHAIERALILSRGGVIGPEAFDEGKPLSGGVFENVSVERGLHENVVELERSLVERALRAANGNRSRAAEILKINRRLLYDKLREFGIG